MYLKRAFFIKLAVFITSSPILFHLVSSREVFFRQHPLPVYVCNYTGFPYIKKPKRKRILLL